ncbi:hypothetical protein B0H14DRAFT_3860016 [Mycena olivaceomarginata]|nr:hypothetical protein B0H14DRAFT_3860016 [Mycena olivaceomarginata]
MNACPTLRRADIGSDVSPATDIWYPGSKKKELACTLTRSPDGDVEFNWAGMPEELVTALESAPTLWTSPHHCALSLALLTQYSILVEAAGLQKQAFTSLS